MSDVSSNIKKGVWFNFIEKYSNIAIQILTTAILARLLSPQEFGVVAVVMVFVVFFGLLTEMGVGPAIIQQQSLEEKEISTIFLFTIMIGTIFAALFACMAPYIASFYNDKVYIEITYYLVFVILFSTWSIVPKNLLLKQKKFSAIMKINVVISIVMNGLTIYFAYLGFSYSAILWRSILSALAGFIAYYFCSQIKVSFIWKPSGLKKIYKFSFFQFAFNFINYFSRNLDNLLIGKYLGVSFLGLYEKAYTLMLLPVNNLTHVLTPVLQTSLVQHQNEPEIVYEIYLKLIKILAFVGVPVSVFCYFNSYEIIYLFFGEKWLGIVPTFQILSLSIWIQVILSSSGSIFQVVNRTDLLFLSGFLSAIAMIAMIILGVYEGSLESIAFYLLVAFSINFMQGYYILIKIALKQEIKRFCMILIKPLCIGIIMTAIMHLVPHITNIGLAIGIKGIILLGVYLLCLYSIGEISMIRQVLRIK